MTNVATPSAADRTAGPETSGLVVADLVVSYGGNVAANGVGLSAPLGRITGLIGPNGAGKTTTFNACTGIVRPDRGTVQLSGHEITRRPVHRRCQLGLGRTFQRMELFESLSVWDNVSLGREAALAGSRPLTHLWGGRRAAREIADATRDAIALCGLERSERDPVSALSTGQRRLVELARVVAGRSDVLLLDEPSSGLDLHETARFAEVLRALVADRGVGILLVEHDMSLVMGTCDYIYVLEFGMNLFEGAPDEVRSSELVRAAYLGSSAP